MTSVGIASAKVRPRNDRCRSWRRCGTLHWYARKSKALMDRRNRMRNLKFGWSATGVLAAAVMVVAGIVYALVIRPWQLRRGATDAEVRRSLPGDDLVPDPKCGYTQAVTIKAPVSEVWPWLVQIGYKRAGWYSHDLLHRLMGIAGSVDDERRSAKRIIPELQDLGRGCSRDRARNGICSSRYRAGAGVDSAK